MRKTANSSPLSARKTLKVAFAAAVLGALGLAPALLTSTSAEAAVLDAITGVTITSDPPGSPVKMWDSFDVNATWAAPADAKAGDTFALGLPAEVTSFASSFDMKDDSGEVVGTCDVSEKGFLCTLSDYVETHQNVTGGVAFRAQLTKESSTGRILFTTGTDVEFTIPLPGPGGPVGPGEPSTAPSKPVKWGWVDHDGETMVWKIFVPSEFLVPVAGKDVVLTDTYDARLTFDPSTLTAGWVAKSGWDAGDWTKLPQGSGNDTYTLKNDPATHSFSVVFNKPNTDGSRVYGFWYTTKVPANAKAGDVYSNKVSGTGLNDFSSNIEIVEASGYGRGVMRDEATGGFSVLKDVTGTGAGSVPATTTYTINYSYELDGQTVTGSLALGDGESGTVDSLPVGTVVTITEAKPAAIAGVTYQTPVYSAQGGTAVDGGIQITIGDSTTVAVTVENPTTLVATPPVEETPPPLAMPAPVPAPAPTPDEPLASTGSEASPALITGFLLIVVGSGLVLLRRRALAGGKR